MKRPVKLEDFYGQEPRWPRLTGFYFLLLGVGLVIWWGLWFTAEWGKL